MITLCSSSFLNGCKEDETGPINEEEVITTLRLTFTPVGGGTAAILQFQDTDGGGGNAPVITADTLNANTNYNVAIEVLNESVNPTSNISDEIAEEG